MYVYSPIFNPQLKIFIKCTKNLNLEGKKVNELGLSLG